MRNRIPYYPIEMLEVRVQQTAAEAQLPLQLKFDGWRWSVSLEEKEISDPLDAPDVRLWTDGFRAAIRLVEGGRIGGGAK
jgi:hypothetical protein